jgi:hypothetical protein
MNATRAMTPAAPAAPIGVRLDFNRTSGEVLLELDFGLQFECPDCDWGLDLSQPDEDDPDRLIGQCLNCRQSFIVTRSPGDDDYSNDWSNHALERIGSRNADPVRMDPAIGVWS